MNPRHQNRTYHIFYLILQFENKKGTTIWELIPITVFQTKRYNPACFMQFDNKKACNYRTFINWPSYQPIKHKKLQTCSSIRWEANLSPIGMRRCFAHPTVLTIKHKQKAMKAANDMHDTGQIHHEIVASSAIC
jgi:hypothetical protein